nr:hypothetical protein 41 [Balneolaceae bacterium]
MDLRYTCTKCGDKHEMLQPCPENNAFNKDAPASDVEAVVIPFGDGNNLIPFTIEWWMGVEYKAYKEALSADKWMGVYAKEGNDIDASYYYVEAKRYYAIWRYCRERIVQKFYSQKV